MQHKMTRQYARDVEIPLAEFNNGVDADFFLKVKLASDAEMNVAAIYRLYQNGQRRHEVNRGKINIAGIPERYSLDEDDRSVPLNGYKIAAQELINAPVPCANFTGLNDARLFIQKKLLADTAANKKITYRILQNNQMVEKIDPVKPGATENQPESAQSGAANKTAFRPTPFNPVPRPVGSPQGWIKEMTRERAGEKEEEK